MGQEPQFIWIKIYSPMYSRTYTYENKYSYLFLEPPWYVIMNSWFYYAELEANCTGDSRRYWMPQYKRCCYISLSSKHILSHYPSFWEVFIHGARLVDVPVQLHACQNMWGVIPTLATLFIPARTGTYLTANPLILELTCRVKHAEVILFVCWVGWKDLELIWYRMRTVICLQIPTFWIGERITSASYRMFVGLVMLGRWKYIQLSH
jgi:hypothetical protein